MTDLIFHSDIKQAQILSKCKSLTFYSAAGQAEGGMITKAVAREKAEEGLAVVREATSILQVITQYFTLLSVRIHLYTLFHTYLYMYMHTKL